MLKARLKNGGLILGIDKINLEFLKKGMPIRVAHSEIGSTTDDIFIIYGDTMQHIIDELNTKGFFKQTVSSEKNDATG